jgi:hypothetical protein
VFILFVYESILWITNQLISLSHADLHIIILLLHLPRMHNSHYKSAGTPIHRMRQVLRSSFDSENEQDEIDSIKTVAVTSVPALDFGGWLSRNSRRLRMRSECYNFIATHRVARMRSPHAAS